MAHSALVPPASLVLGMSGGFVWMMKRGGQGHGTQKGTEVGGATVGGVK